MLTMDSCRFWLKQASLSCQGDRCWEDLGRPLSGPLPAEERARVVQAAILGLLLLLPAIGCSWRL
jgi:hypothetical protein